MESGLFTSLATSWLQEAGELVLQMMQRGLSSELKGDATPVTAIDRAVEALLKQRIRDAFPDHGIIGEESDSYQPGAEWCWTIDPIDGTRALLAGFASFTTLLALAYQGKPRFGAIYQPITQELWLGGETSTLNGKPIRTRPCTQFSEALFSTTSPLLFAPQHRQAIEKIMKNCMAYQLGGDAYAYGKLAAGHIDLIVESGLKPHDFMALVPVIEGAGGIVTDWHGQPLTLDSAGDICATGDARLHHEALALLRRL